MLFNDAVPSTEITHLSIWRENIYVNRKYAGLQEW